MASERRTETERVPGSSPNLYFAVLVPTLLLALIAVFVFDRAVSRSSVFLLSNFVGPTASTLLHGRGLTVCSEGMGTLGNPICYHAARMPVASAMVALGATVVGDHYLRVGFFKALLLLLPLQYAMLLCCRRIPAAGWRRAASVALLVLPFLLTPFLADVVNMQVEEGYSYSLLTLALALVLFPSRGGPDRARIVLFAATAAVLYLAKSSMAPAVAVLTLAFLWPLRRRPALAGMTVALVLAAPLGWALWQHHTAGRYTLGTSLDGANLHKGNNDMFLSRYPPPPGVTLDAYDPAFNHGLYFPDEWSFNDYHQRAAVAFIRSHPGATANAAVRKLFVIFLSVEKVGSRGRGGAMERVETVGLVLFRLLLWLALGVSAWSVVRSRDPAIRSAAGVFLALVAAVALPYVVGFAYTRHVSVLIYPAALLCCRALATRGTPNSARPKGLH